MFNGHQPTLILASLLNEDLSALEVIEHVKRSSGVRLGVSGIYAQMQRLVKGGLLEAYYEKKVSDGGRPRRLYRLNAKGQRAVDQVLATAGVSYG